MGGAGGGGGVTTEQNEEADEWDIREEADGRKQKAKRTRKFEQKN